MSEKTNIEWATSTGNPWIGCTKVSPGCKHCYAAELDAQRFSKTMGGGASEKPVSHWGPGAPRVRTKAFWADAVKWDREHSAQMQTMRRPRIFPSLCDWLDEEVPIKWLADFLKLIHDTPNLDWLLLTKRPENFFTRVYDADQFNLSNAKAGDSVNPRLDQWVDAERIPANVWIGVSVEDQQRADERIPLLLKIPARVRFLSVEPLLEHVNLNLNTVNHDWMCQGPAATKPAIHWGIVGGESGKDRRDCGVDAIIAVAAQFVAAGMAAFVKQDCAFKPGQQGRIPADIWALKQFPHPMTP